MDNRGNFIIQVRKRDGVPAVKNSVVRGFVTTTVGARGACIQGAAVVGSFNEAVGEVTQVSTVKELCVDGVDIEIDLISYGGIVVPI